MQCVGRESVGRKAFERPESQKQPVKPPLEHRDKHAVTTLSWPWVPPTARGSCGGGGDRSHPAPRSARWRLDRHRRQYMEVGH